MSSTTSAPSNPYLADLAPPVCGLDIANSFAQLTPKEKLYAHWQSKAGWEGARIIMAQASHDAIYIIDFLLALVSQANLKASEEGQPKKVLADLAQVFDKAGLNEEEQEWFLAYTSQVLGNLSNFKSFGFSKFIPRLSEATFARLVATSSNSEVASLWEKVKGPIYTLEPKAHLTIGKPSFGHTSGYYLPASTTFNDQDAKYIQGVLEKHNVDQLNTRVEKLSDDKFVVWIASQEIGEKELEGGKVIIKKGDFSKELAGVSKALLEAKKHAANKTQEMFIDDYVESFKTGSIEAHVKGSENWVKDAGPVVESYIGFIETYVDPYGGRAEWEAFTAIVNKELSAKYDKLVDAAPELIKNLPWGAAFEVDKFIKPGFSALEIVSFATGSIPAGINIPNYFSVRDKTGFKNVSLANITAAKDPNEKLTFLSEEDVPLWKEYESRAWELQVAIHELLGHGSGKLFQEAADGSLNFDKNTINPLTGAKVDSWYLPGQTAGSVLGECSSSYEECRAEAVALYLCSNEDILKLFNYTDRKTKEDLQVAMFLMMVRAGLRALEFYNPETKKHGQAHMQARIGITNAMIKDGIVSLEEQRDEAGKLIDAFVKVDREKVLKEGNACMGKLLVELQVRKCTADGEGARRFYKSLTNPLPGWDGELRDLVILKKAPRKIFCQPNTFVVDGEVVLKEYPLTLTGLLQSTVERLE